MVILDAKAQERGRFVEVGVVGAVIRATAHGAVAQAIDKDGPTLPV